MLCICCYYYARLCCYYAASRVGGTDGARGSWREPCAWSSFWKRRKVLCLNMHPKRPSSSILTLHCIPHPSLPLALLGPPGERKLVVSPFPDGAVTLPRSAQASVLHPHRPTFLQPIFLPLSLYLPLWSHGGQDSGSCEPFHSSQHGGQEVPDAWRTCFPPCPLFLVLGCWEPWEMAAQERGSLIGDYFQERPEGDCW